MSVIEINNIIHFIQTNVKFISLKTKEDILMTAYSADPKYVIERPDGSTILLEELAKKKDIETLTKMRDTIESNI